MCVCKWLYMQIYLHNRHLHLWFADSEICPELSFTLWTAPDTYFTTSHYSYLPLNSPQRNSAHDFTGIWTLIVYSAEMKTVSDANICSVFSCQQMTAVSVHRVDEFMNRSRWITPASEELLFAIWPEMCQVPPSQSEGVRGIFSVTRSTISRDIISPPQSWSYKRKILHKLFVYRDMLGIFAIVERISLTLLSCQQ